MGSPSAFGFGDRNLAGSPRARSVPTPCSGPQTFLIRDPPLETVFSSEFTAPGIPVPSTPIGEHNDHHSHVLAEIGMPEPTSSPPTCCWTRPPSWGAERPRSSTPKSRGWRVEIDPWKIRAKYLADRRDTWMRSEPCRAVRSASRHGRRDDTIEHRPVLSLRTVLASKARTSKRNTR